LNRLTEALLVETSYLLQCRNTSNPLTRLKDRNLLSTPTIGGLICASCGRPYSQELLSPGYSVSELGQRSIRGSHWLTVWITSRLVELDIPTESILWNLEFESEEVDLIVGFLGGLWIFELKDRDFAAGHAHALNYRRVRYGADKTFIVTTGKSPSRSEESASRAST
jgi:hypothetical protein